MPQNRVNDTIMHAKLNAITNVVQFLLNICPYGDDDCSLILN